MKNNWLSSALFTILILGLTCCDREPLASKGSTTKPRIIAPGSLEPLVEKAWNLMNARKYDECSAFIDAEFAKIESKAREQEKGLQFFPEMKAGYKWHELDGAGNLLRVKQESLKRQGKLDEAVPVWEMMFYEFPHFQSWRVPNRTWRPAEEAREDWQAHRLLKAIKERKLADYDYVSDTIFDEVVRGRTVSVVGRTLIEDKEFDALEYACDFFTTNPMWQNVSRSDFWGELINGGLSPQHKSQDSQWQKKRERLQQWVKDKPNSIWAPVGLASFWIDYAWAARGSGWADSVTKEDWKKFHDRIKTAHETLDAAKRECPLWDAERLTVCMAESAEPSEVNELFIEGAKKYPWFSSVYTRMTTILLPRWLGQPGDWQNFASMIGKEVGAATYLQICLTASWYEDRTNVVNDKTVNWTLMKEGFEEQIKNNPKDLWLKNTYAAYAWLRKDQTAGKRAFELINNKAHPSVWDTEAGYLDVKRWAEK